MESGAIYLTVLSFTLSVPSSGCFDKFRMSCGRRCFWGTAAIWYSLRFSLNNLTTSTSGKRILNPSHTLWCNSPRMNAVILGVHVEAWGPFEMERSKALRGQAGPVCNGMQLSTYSCSRGAAGC